MSNSVISSGVSVLLAVIGVAIIAVLVSKQANTSSVITQFGKSFSGGISCALSPVIGGGNCGTSVSTGITFN